MHKHWGFTFLSSSTGLERRRRSTLSLSKGRRVGVESSYERSELETRDRALVAELAIDRFYIVCQCDE